VNFGRFLKKISPKDRKMRPNGEISPKSGHTAEIGDFQQQTICSALQVTTMQKKLEQLRISTLILYAGCKKIRPCKKVPNAVGSGCIEGGARCPNERVTKMTASVARFFFL
jgi:hypothetical protein